MVMSKVMQQFRESLRTLGGKLTPEYLFNHTKLAIRKNMRDQLQIMKEGEIERLDPKGEV
jgi:hypothetical protein